MKKETKSNKVLEKHYKITNNWKKLEQIEKELKRTHKKCETCKEWITKKNFERHENSNKHNEKRE